jgi:tetratricopeptide (TPR) repeat protein
MVVLANQMTGVCYQRLHEYGTATEFYLLAMEEASDYERGNIERDLAESYGALGEYELAESSLAKSLDLLPYAKYPEEHAQSLGHLARLQLRQGQIAEAVDTFADAAAKLKAGHYLQAELYPELDYASALSRDGQLAKARLVAFHSLKLSLSKNPQTGRPYGSRQHHMRALALITGGHSLEDYLKKRKVR